MICTAVAEANKYIAISDAFVSGWYWGVSAEDILDTIFEGRTAGKLADEIIKGNDLLMRLRRRDQR